MQINSINNNHYNQNFGAFYRLPKDQSGKDAYEILRDTIAPLYTGKTDEPMRIFMGKHPAQAFYLNQLIEQFKSFGCSFEWAKAHAEMYGANLKCLDSPELLVVTTNKDVSKIEEFLKKKSIYMHYVSIKGIFDLLVRRIKHPPVTDPEVPKYLYNVFGLLQDESLECKQFYHFMSGENIKTPNNLFELAYQIMHE